MHSDAVKANEKQFFEYVNNRDTKAIDNWIDSFVSECFVNHNPTFDIPKNRNGLKEMFRILFKMFPDMNITITDLVFENEILCFRTIVSGIRNNEDLNGLAMIKFKNGKITDRWATTEPI